MWGLLKKSNIKTVVEDIVSGSGEFTNLVVTGNLAVTGTTTLAGITINNVSSENINVSYDVVAGNNITASNNISASGLISGDTLIINDLATFNKDVKISGNITSNGDATFVGDLKANNITAVATTTTEDLNVLDEANITGNLTAGNLTSTNTTTTKDLTVSNDTTLNKLNVNGDSTLKDVKAGDIEADNLTITGTLTAPNMNIVNITMSDITSSKIDTEEVTTEKLNATDVTITNDLETYNLKVTNLIDGKITEAQKADLATNADNAVKVSNKLLFGDYIEAIQTSDDTTIDNYDGSKEVKFSINADIEATPDTIVQRDSVGDIKSRYIHADNFILNNGFKIVTIPPDINNITLDLLPKMTQIFKTSQENSIILTNYYSVTVVGAGGGGGYSSTISSGGGGAGGNIITKILLNNGLPKHIVIGIGGQGGKEETSIEATNGGYSYICDMVRYVDSGNYERVNILPTSNINNSKVYILNGDILTLTNYTFWKYDNINNIWSEMFPYKINSIEPPIIPLYNNYYSYNETYVKCGLNWIKYTEPTNIINYDSFIELSETYSMKRDEDLDNDLFKISGIGDFVFDRITYEKGSVYFKQKETLTPVSSSTLPTNPKRGDVIELTAADGGFNSGDILVYDYQCKDITQAEFDALTYIDLEYYDENTVIALGGEGGKSDGTGGKGRFGYGDGGNGATSGKGEDGKPSLYCNSVAKGGSVISFSSLTEKMVDKLPETSDINCYYTLTQDDGDKLSGTSWFNKHIFGYYKRYIKSTDIIDMSSTVNNPDDLVVNMDTFDFNKYYKFGNNNTYIIIKFLNYLGNVTTGDDISYLPMNFDGNFDILDINKQYSFLKNQIINGIEFRSNMKYKVNYIVLNINDYISDDGAGGGAGGSSFSVGGDGGNGGFNSSIGLLSTYTNNGSGGGGGGTGNNISNDGGNGSNGLIIITYLN